MKKRDTLYPLLFITVLMTLSVPGAGCSATPPAQPPAGDWYIAGYTPVGGTARAAPASPFSIGLDADGHAAGQVACNRWRGQYTANGNRLEFGQLTSTRARCHYPDSAAAYFGHRFLQRLEQGARYRQSDGELLLTFDDGERWRLRTAPASD